MGQLNVAANMEGEIGNGKISVAQPKIIDGYWVNMKGEKITHDYVDEKVFFYVKTENTKDDAEISINLHGNSGYALIPDQIYTSSPLKSTVKNNIGIFEVDLKSLLKNRFIEGVISLYGKAYFGKNYAINKKIPLTNDCYLKCTDLGHIKSYNCRIKVDDSGIIHWNPDNCTLPTKNSYYNYIQNKDNWTYDPNRPDQRDLGVRNSTYLCNFKYEKVEKGPTARMNRDRTNPNADDTVITIKVEVAKSTGRTDRRYRGGTIRAANPAGQGRATGAAVILVINAINFGLEYGPIIMRSYDESKIESHYNLLMNSVLPDIITAINKDNVEIDFISLHRLCNIVLYGYCDGIDSNSELYNLGRKIYKEISNFRKE